MRTLLAVIFQIVLLTSVAPCLAQAPAAGGLASQTEISFWESVKDSQDPAELQAYLDKYPNGAFSGLAKIRIERLKSKAGSSPEQGSSIPSDPFPKVGDTWTYRYTDLWKPGEQPSISHTVKRVGEGQILDARSGPKGADEFLYTSQPVLTQRAGAAYEFSPYYFVFGQLPVGQSFRLRFTAADYFSPWNVTGRVVGFERVSVPAGTFDTVKVELQGMRQVNDPRATYPSQMKQTLWYSKQAKRAVKYIINTVSAWSGPSDRDVYELSSYTLN